MQQYKITKDVILYSYPIIGVDSSRKVRLLEYLESRYMKVVKLPGDAPGTYFCQRLSRPQDHSAAGKIKSVKNSSDLIDNQSHSPLACSSVTQPALPPCAYSKRRKFQL